MLRRGVREAESIDRDLFLSGPFCINWGLFREESSKVLLLRRVESAMSNWDDVHHQPSQGGGLLNGLLSHITGARGCPEASARAPPQPNGGDAHMQGDAPPLGGFYPPGTGQADPGGYRRGVFSGKGGGFDGQAFARPMLDLDPQLVQQHLHSKDRHRGRVHRVETTFCVEAKYLHRKDRQRGHPSVQDSTSMPI